MRTTATAPLPGGVARAAMVSTAPEFWEKSHPECGAATPDETRLSSFCPERCVSFGPEGDMVKTYPRNTERKILLVAALRLVPIRGRRKRLSLWTARKTGT